MGKVLPVCNACFRQRWPLWMLHDGRSGSGPPRRPRRRDVRIASTGGPKVRNRPFAPGRTTGGALEARGRRTGVNLRREAAADLVIPDERRSGRRECALAGRIGVVPGHQGAGPLRIERHAQGGLGPAPILFVERGRQRGHSRFRSDRRGGFRFVRLESDDRIRQRARPGRQGDEAGGEETQRFDKTEHWPITNLTGPHHASALHGHERHSLE